MRHWIRYLTLFLFILLYGIPLHAQQSASFKIKKKVAAAGGGNAGSTSKLTSVTIGQGAIGKLSSTSYKTKVGFQNTVITVVAPSAPPTDILLSANSFDENLPDSTQVALLSTTDPDLGETHTYTFVAGSGGQDNSKFYISGSSLRSAIIYDFELKDTYNIKLKTDDGHGGTFVKSFIIFINDVNDPPSLVSLNDSTILEDQAIGTLVGTLSAVDQDPSESFTYSLVTGVGDDDNGSFTITGTQLKSAEIFQNYIKNLYTIRIQVEDGIGDTLTKQFFIYIDKVNHVPASFVISDSLILENEPIGTLIGTFSASDTDPEDIVNYSLISGTGDTDNGFFIADSVTGNLTMSVSPDFESKSQFSIRLMASDGNPSGQVERIFTILVQDENEPPTGITLSDAVILENENSGTLIGTLSATDPDSGESFVYNFTGDFPDSIYFSISGSQLISDSVFNYETTGNFSIAITTTDQGSNSITDTLNIIIGDIDDIPSDLILSNTDIDENLSSGSVIGNLSSLDEDLSDTHTYILVTGTGDDDNSSFSISGSQLLSATSFNFELQNSFSILLQTDDGNGGTLNKPFTIAVNDMNDPPSGIELSDTLFQEELAINTVIGTFTVTDDDTLDTHTLTLEPGTGGEDNASFNILGNDLRSSIVFNFAGKSQYKILVKAKDSSGDSLIISLNIYITEFNNIPTNIVLTDSTLNENLPVNSLVCSMAALDADLEDIHTFTLVTGTGSTDNSSFTLTDEALYSAVSFNYEIKNSYSIRIKTNDGKTGGDFEKIFTIHVNDVNDAPFGIFLDSNYVFENKPIGTFITAVHASDEDAGDTLTFSLPAGQADNSHFQISGDSLLTASVFNKEAQGFYNIKVTCTDKSGADTVGTTTISVVDVDEIAPVISASNFPEFYESGSGNKTLQVTATDNVSITRASVFHKGVGDIAFSEGSVSITTAPTFTFTFNESMVDEMGMDFRFVVYDASGNKDSVTGTILRSFEESTSPMISGLKFGGKLSTYQIISIPYLLNDNKILSVFSNLGPYDKFKWRIFTYNNSAGNYKEFDAFNNISIGTGYWFNAVKSTEIQIGAGKSPVYEGPDNAYLMNLSQGWNQIGNPFPFSIAWADVKDANTGAGFGEPKSTDDGVTYKNLTVIPAFRGAFVKADANMEIIIPSIDANAAGGREEESAPGLKNPINSDQWQVTLEFQTGDYTYSLGGFGMHPQASSDNDRYDDYSAPRLFDYLEINFKDANGKSMFTRDIVTTSPDHTWDFKAETSLNGQSKISWDNSYFGQNDLELVLFDVTNQVLTDMRKSKEYHFNAHLGNEFKVLFGGREYIDSELKLDQNLLALPYPNPFHKEVIIPFNVKSENHSIAVEISIYDQYGKQVKNLVRDNYFGGIYQTAWNGRNFTGANVAPGMYYCIMNLPGEKGVITHSRKIILQ